MGATVHNLSCIRQQPELFVKNNAGCNRSQMDLGPRIKAARAHAGLTQAQLAKLVGMTQQMIQKLESGRADATASLLDICIETGVSPRWLARNEGSMLDSQPLILDPDIIRRAHAELDTYYSLLAGKEYDIEADPDLFAKAYEYLSKEEAIVEAGERFDFARWLARVLKGVTDGATSEGSGSVDSREGGRSRATTKV